MLQNNSLPSNEQIAFQTCIGRMAGGAFGTLATFPLYCLGELTASGFSTMVEEKYEVWQSLLMVARELLRTHSLMLSKCDPTLAAMLVASREIRDAYLELAEYQKVSPETAAASYDKLAAAYGAIRDCVEKLQEILGAEIDLSPIMDRLIGWRKYYDNSLRWFGAEIYERTHHQPIADIQNAAG